jgi:hypothetical protein
MANNNPTIITSSTCAKGLDKSDTLGGPAANASLVLKPIVINTTNALTQLCLEKYFCIMTVHLKIYYLIIKWQMIDFIHDSFIYSGYPNSHHNEKCKKNS